MIGARMIQLFPFCFYGSWQYVPRPTAISEHKTIRQITGLALNMHSLSSVHDVY